jgi:hypothetical protein
MAIIQVRRDPDATWTTNNPILAEGELGFAIDTNGLKCGDGVHHWSELDPVNVAPA